MKIPSDAQAAMLRLVEEHEKRGEVVEWLTNAGETAGSGYLPSRAVLYVERIDRERNVGSFQPVEEGCRSHRLATVNACLKAGWLTGGERMYTSRREAYSVQLKRQVEKKETWWLKELGLTEDGTIALGVWRERKLKAPPAPAPVLTEREREIVALSRRALELGYCLAAREPVRPEARKLKKDGWFQDGGCWIANNASGLVPTATAIATVLPELADAPPTPYPGERQYKRAGSLAVEAHLP